MGKRQEARKSSAQRTRIRRRNKQNKSGIICISLIVLMLVAVMSVRIVSMYDKNESCKEKEHPSVCGTLFLERQQELKEYKEYVTTKEYIEQVAKTKLGLVYSNEIIFKEKDSSR